MTRFTPLKSLILIVLAFSASVISAQVKTSAFREFESDDFLDRCISLKTHGIIMYGWEDKTTLKLKLLDTGLRDVRSWTISTEKRASIKDIAYSEKNNLVVILLSLGKNKFRFITLDPDQKKFKSTDMDLPKKTYFKTNMLMVGDEVWMGAYTKKAQLIFRISLKSPRLMPLNTDLAGDKVKFNISSIQVLDNEEVAVTYFHGPKKMREMDVAVLNSNGKLIANGLLKSLSVEKRAKLLDGSVTRLAEGDYSLTGTYAKKTKGAIGNGVYFARYSEGKVRYLSFFDYSDFEHFNDYLADKKQERLEKKIAKKKAKGKEVTLTRLSVEHSAKVVNGGLVFIAEYYYPTYRYETRTEFVNGKPVTRTEKVFDGFQYTNGMAIGISNDGEKLFDQNIPLMAPYKPFSVIRFLRVFSDSTNVRVLHTNGRLVLSSVISGSDITNNQWAVTHTIPEGQREKWTASASMYWYGNTFFIMEQQKTREKGLLGKRQMRYYGAGVTVE